MQQPHYTQNRGYQQRPNGGNIPRQHPPQHHMGQQPPQHQGQPQQGNPQQQARPVQMQQHFQYQHQQPQVFLTSYATQLSQNMTAPGQNPITYPARLYYHPYATQAYQQPQIWSGIPIPQAQQPQAYYQPAVQGQVPTQLHSAHQQYYNQGAAIQPAYIRSVGVGLPANSQQPMQIQHQPSHTGHHPHTQQHVQPTQGVPVQGSQAPIPQPPEPREVVPNVPRERKVLKIINPDTGETVIETPPVPPPPPTDSSTPPTEVPITSMIEDVQTPTPQVVPTTVVTQVNNQPGDDVKPAETEEPAYPRSSARTEFYQKISKSAEEDRTLSEATTPSPNSSAAIPTSSSSPAESEVSIDIPIQTPVVSIDKEINQQQSVVEVVEEDREEDLDITRNNIQENSLVDISSVSIDQYIDETPEDLSSPAESDQPFTTVINEPEPGRESPVVKVDNTVAVEAPPQEPSPPLLSTNAPTPNDPQAHETEIQSLIITTKIEETSEMTDVNMQNKNVEEEVLLNGDEVTEGDDDGEEFADEEAPESVEDGEIVDSTSEEPEEIGKKKRIRYDRDTLLGFKAVASKDVLPDMNSIPPEVIRDGKSSNNNHHSRGSSSPYPLRMGGHPGGPNRNRMPQIMGMGRTGMFNMTGPLPVPPPPPSSQKHRIEIYRQRVELHKADDAWKPNVIGGRRADKDEEELAKEEIVKKTRGILNKLTPENFDKLVVAFLDLNLDDKDDRIAAVIYVVFEKAIDEPSFSTAYANMVKTVCDRSQLTAKKFRKNILDQCQKEFQKGSNAEDEIRALEESLATAVEEKKDELNLELNDKKHASRRRSLGNVRFIGELYKLQMLTPKIMIDCIGILLGNEDEESYESLCKLLTTIGQRLDNQLKELEAKAHIASRNPSQTNQVKFIPPDKYMDKTFSSLKNLSKDMKLSSRIRFALLDAVELRESGWKPRRDADGPKKIQDVHRDAIRQQQEEKNQLQNLPPPGPPMRQNMLPPKKPMSDWSTVPPSNKSSRFMVKKPVSVSSVGESSGGPMLAPNRGGTWCAPSAGGQLPPKSNTFVPPRMQNQGRFGVLSQDTDRAPPPTPLRENIVQVPPPPLRTQGSRESSRPQTPTRDQPMKPEPFTTPASPQPSVKDDVPLGERVKGIFEEFMSTNSWEDMFYYIQEKFPGEKVTEFVDELSRQVCEMSKENLEKGAGALVKGLIKKNLINKAQVIKVFTEGVMVDLRDIEVDVPKVTSYFGVFLVELFLDDPDLSWLLGLGDRIEEESATVWTDLVTNTLNCLKFRLSEEAVQVLYKKTQGANRLPVQELSWISESVEALSKKMVLVLEKEKDSGNISQSFRENSWDLREELTGKSLTEAICQISWKASTGWDVPVLQKLLPQLSVGSPKLHAMLWGQAKEFIKRNSIQSDAEEELWAEMHKLKIISSETQQTQYC